VERKAKIKPKDERILHTKSGNRCAICRAVLVDAGNPNAACIGENAHIYGEKPDAARYDASKDETFVNSEKNLIFLCCSCHKKVDTDTASYPVEKLFKLKTEHELWVEQSLEEQSMSYSFAELEVLANYLIKSNAQTPIPTSFYLLKIEKKIEKNALQDVQRFITMGLSSNSTIEDYFNRHPDPTLATQITNIMSNKYVTLKTQGLDSTDIFYELWDFASGAQSDFNYKAAGLGILSYFFEKCEVFEK
jgi:hypothetical protein